MENRLEDLNQNIAPEIQQAVALLRRWHGEDAKTHLLHGLGVRDILECLNMGALEQAVGLLQTSMMQNSVERLQQVEQILGSQASGLMAETQKIGRASFLGAGVSRAEHMRQMIMASVNDPRVLLILSAERLQSLRQSQLTHTDNCVEMAQETRTIYAPIAHRLGIDFLHSEMEDLCFAVLEPTAYQSLQAKVKHLTEEGQAHLDWLKMRLSRLLKAQAIDAEVSGRLKGLRSLHIKMQRRQSPIERIYDLIAARVIVDSEEECYRALGIIHADGVPVPGRFKDYIALPKANGYRSLHTTISDNQGGRFEIQIRTRLMHREAELGVAAHFGYKHGNLADAQEVASLKWFRSLLEHLPEGLAFNDSVDLIGRELIADQLFLFSPKGEVVKLPPKATAVDFAYAIHTKLGETCVGAKMDTRMVSIRTPLKNGSVVEILTNNHQNPKREWLNFVVSAKARHRIRAALRQQESDRSIHVGKVAIQKILRPLEIKLETLLEKPPVQEWMRRNNLHTVEDIYLAEGFKRIHFKQSFIRLAKELEIMLPHTKGFLTKEPTVKKEPTAKAYSPEVLIVDGVEGVPTRLARCCAPVNGDPVVGLISRGRGVSVHHQNCMGLVRKALHPERVVNVRWSDVQRNLSPVHIEIQSKTSMREMLGLISIIEAEKAEVTSGRIHSGNGVYTQQITLMVDNYAQVQRILMHLNAVEGITARRTLEVN